MDATKTRTIVPVKGVGGSVRLPGDKSISHRYAMLGALAKGTTKLENFSSAADCASTLRCVEALGAKITRTGLSVDVEGTGGELHAPNSPLDCGNSGSTMRMLAGVVAGFPFHTEMMGDESLSRRPMKRIMDPLTRMGAKVRGSNDGLPPLIIDGARLRAIDFEMEIPSAQVKSCVLLAGMFAEGTTSIVEPLPTRDHTELALKAFGAELQVNRSERRVAIRGGQKLQALEAYVPGDLSTATFFLCATALFPGSSMIFDHVLLNPSRATILDVMAQLGLRISFLKVEEQHGELIGTIQVHSGELRGAKISGATTAAVIDELPALAAIAPYTRDGIEVSNAKELRVKETDRIAAVAENLRRMGATIEEREDGFRIEGGQALRGAEVESFGDHRIAMAFSVAALRADGETRVHGAESVAVSYPEFYTSLESIVQ